MNSLKIDYNRGVMIMTHNASGMNVYMYLDTPGDYLNAFEGPVSEQLAKEAGYDVEKYGKEKIKRIRMAQAKEAIEAELNNADVTNEVVREKNGFKVVDIGLGRHKVEDPDGNTLTAVYLPKEQAFFLLDQLAPDPVPEKLKKAKSD